MRKFSGNQVIELDGDLGQGEKVVTARLTSNNQEVNEADRFSLKKNEQIKLILRRSKAKFTKIWLFQEVGGEDPGKTCTLLSEDITEKGVERDTVNAWASVSSWGVSKVEIPDVHLSAHPRNVTFTHKPHRAVGATIVSVEEAHYRFSVRFEIDGVEYDWDPDVHNLGGT